MCGYELTGGVKKFVKLVAENKRIPLLPEIVEVFEQFKSNREKSVDVNVTTVFELDDDVQQKLNASLNRKLDREVNLQTTIDKSLLGGVIIHAADIVIDGSVRGRLAKLAESMQS